MAINVLREKPVYTSTHKNQPRLKSSNTRLRNSTRSAKICKFPASVSRCLATEVAMATNWSSLESKVYTLSYETNPTEIRPQDVEKFDFSYFRSISLLTISCEGCHSKTIRDSEKLQRRVKFLIK